MAHPVISTSILVPHGNEHKKFTRTKEKEHGNKLKEMNDMVEVEREKE